MFLLPDFVRVQCSLPVQLGTGRQQVEGEFLRLCAQFCAFGAVRGGVRATQTLRALGGREDSLCGVVLPQPTVEGDERRNVSVTFRVQVLRVVKSFRKRVCCAGELGQ